MTTSPDNKRNANIAMILIVFTVGPMLGWGLSRVTSQQYDSPIAVQAAPIPVKSAKPTAAAPASTTQPSAAAAGQSQQYTDAVDWQNN